MPNNIDDSAQNEFASLWLERTELKISDKLPGTALINFTDLFVFIDVLYQYFISGILRWFPVVKTSTYEMSPLQVAVETMKETNKNLRIMILQYKADESLHLEPLTRTLSGQISSIYVIHYYYRLKT